MNAPEKKLHELLDDFDTAMLVTRTRRPAEVSTHGRC